MASQTLVFMVRCPAPGSQECRHPFDHDVAMQGFKDEIARHLRHTPSTTRYTQPLFEEDLAQRGPSWMKLRVWVPEAHDEAVWRAVILESTAASGLAVEHVVFGSGEPAVR